MAHLLTQSTNRDCWQPCSFSRTTNSHTWRWISGYGVNTVCQHAWQVYSEQLPALFLTSSTWSNLIEVPSQQMSWHSSNIVRLISSSAHRHYITQRPEIKNCIERDSKLANGKNQFRNSRTVKKPSIWSILQIERRMSECCSVYLCMSRELWALCGRFLRSDRRDHSWSMCSLSATDLACEGLHAWAYKTTIRLDEFYGLRLICLAGIALAAHQKIRFVT